MTDRNSTEDRGELIGRLLSNTTMQQSCIPAGGSPARTSRMAAKVGPIHPRTTHHGLSTGAAAATVIVIALHCQLHQIPHVSHAPAHVQHTVPMLPGGGLTEPSPPRVDHLDAVYAKSRDGAENRHWKDPDLITTVTTQNEEALDIGKT
jgi:hypothetical protein